MASSRVNLGAESRDKKSPRINIKFSIVAFKLAAIYVGLQLVLFTYLFRSASFVRLANFCSAQAGERSIVTSLSAVSYTHLTLPTKRIV